MIQLIRKRFGLKLFLSYLGVVLVAIVVLGSTTQFIAPSAFNRHMVRAGQALAGNDGGGMMGPGMMGQGQRGAAAMGMMDDFYQSFRASFNFALTYALIASSIAAIAASYFFSRRVVAPLRATITASQKLAGGNYEERVQINSQDEFGELAIHFNQMASQLEDVENRRRQLIGDIAHELRTPLTAVVGSMEGLVDGILPGNEETYNQIHQEALRIRRLIDDLQELSRVEAGSFKLVTHPVIAVDLVNTAIRRIERQFEEKGVRLEFEAKPEADSIRVVADEYRTGQVLLNLIGNALQYTPAGGKVRIKIDLSQGDEVIFSVEDTGVGIAEEHHSLIFTRFYRVDKSRSRRAGGGSGLGLAIARHLVEAQGGRIWVTSQGENRGSTFLFTLPKG